MFIYLIVISVAILVILARQIFRNRKDNKEYKKMILNLSSQWDGWVEVADASYHPVMLGKILYSWDRHAAGVGVLVKEHLPVALVSDMDIKIGPQLLDGRWPLCRFLISFQGRDVILTELKDIDLKEKLKSYVVEYSKIQLKIGLDSNEFILVDSKEAESDFERVWKEKTLK